ncbi:MAG TPA: ATP synthase subunit I [Acidimicrobiales bacterium]|nr:ATP synthase subunit I [Acidimicrobiales bacterium]
MERLAALFEQLSLPEMGRVLRHVALAAVGVGVACLGVAIFTSHALFGLGACIGLGLGLVNVRLVSRSVARVAAQSPAKPKRVLASRSLGRLAVSTAVVIGLALLSLPLGFGTAGGLAVFYFLLVALLIRSVLRSNGAAAA